MKKWFKRSALAVAAICLVSGVIWVFLPEPTLYPEGTTFSQQVVDRNGTPLRITLTDDDKYRIFVPLDQISDELKQATLLHEDRHFYRHFGVNPIAVGRSAWNLVSRGPRTGGSTISMQLARLRWKIKSRSMAGKLVQMFRAMQLEKHYTKDDIFEAYLNLAPYGGNIEGIGAASQIYLGKSPIELTRRESVALSVIPQSPARRKPGFDRNEQLAEAQARLFARYREVERLEADPLDAEFTIRRLEKRPFAAPHLARRMLKTDQSRIETTVDIEIQRILEKSAAAYVSRRENLGIRNTSALLIDHTTMEVQAYLGSADFWNEAIHGQVDGVKMRRSPGSTLKPFVYGLALQQGLIHPNTMLKDAKLSYGDGYSPENFDRGYTGPLSATQALQRSRNIPAVALTGMLEEPSFYTFLKRGGVHLPKPSGHYGLTLSLGGSEASLEELVRLYAMLPNRGALQDLVYAAGDAKRPRQILSPEAAFLTLTMIENIPAPGNSRRLGMSADRPVYWKTGTSHGFRDAWAIAIFDRSVLGVWVGDFRGKGNASFVARDATAPLLFDMIGSLRAHNPAAAGFTAQPRGANVRRVNLCATSGQMPNSHCCSTRTGWFIPGLSPIHRCDVHREVLVDEETGLRVRPEEDDGSRPVRREVYEFWPSDLRQMFREAGIAMRQPPPFQSGNRQTDGRLRIVSPARDSIYTLRGDRSQIPLQVTADADSSEIFWFAGKKLIGSVSPETPFFWKNAPIGTHVIRAVDDQGRSGERQLIVRNAAEE
ncbi:MAG: penicillin-binding protein 1C [Verrucomicrobiota bacterium]